ncbi:MAG: hypothetical protein HC808_15885 [Candidatus Competibacteraceae bacterium]|nr:hypothetical protein [Candidatus Competibacteraceae bacterium]
MRNDVVKGGRNNWCLMALTFRQCSCLVALLFSFSVAAQHHYDNVWIFSSVNGAVKADFSSGFPTIDTIGVRIKFEGGSATICNAEGKLQFYTNGCALYNYRHEKMVMVTVSALGITTMSFVIFQAGSSEATQRHPVQR